MQILDAHQHFWRYDRVLYPWIDEKMSVLKGDFLPQNLKPLYDKSGIIGSIAVQARQSLEETHYLLKLASANDWIKGVVGWVDLKSSQLEDQLHNLTHNHALCGIRHLIQDEPDPDFAIRPQFVRGISLLSKFNLTYDILVRPHQMHAALELVRLCPEQAFVIDHLAKPDIRSGKIASWQQSIREIASCHNVFCKLSGMVTEARLRQWHPDDFKPYMDTIFESFGPSRIMFGTDWPVCLLSASLDDVINIVHGYVKQLGDEDRRLIWYDNAVQFYRLKETSENFRE